MEYPDDSIAGVRDRDLTCCVRHIPDMGSELQRKVDHQYGSSQSDRRSAQDCFVHTLYSPDTAYGGDHHFIQISRG